MPCVSVKHLLIGAKNEEISTETDKVDLVCLCFTSAAFGWSEPS